MKFVTRSNKVLGTLKEVYNRIWYIEEGEKLGKYKTSDSKFQKRNEYKS